LDGNGVNIVIDEKKDGILWSFALCLAISPYRDKPKLQPFAAIIGWTQNLVILQRCKEPLERAFYLRMTKKFGWTKGVLIYQIGNQSYEKEILSQIERAGLLNVAV